MTDDTRHRDSRPAATAARRPAPEPRARPDLALLAGPVVDLRRPELIMAGRLEFTGLVDKGDAGRALFLVSISGAIIAVIVQPTVGSISDYTISRWGRRKPYIIIGTILDLVFLHRHRVEQHAGRDRRVHRPPPVQLQLRAGPVPGLHAGPRAGAPGRHGQRARRADAGPRRRRRASSIGGARGRDPQLRAGPRRPRRPRAGDDALGRHPRPRRPAARSRATGARGGPSPPRRGAPTSSGSELHVARRLASHPDGWRLLDPARAVLPRSDDGARASTTPARPDPARRPWSPSGRCASRRARRPHLRSRRPQARHLGGCAIGRGRARRSSQRAEPADRVRRRPAVGVSAGIFLAVDGRSMTDIIPKASSGRYMGISNVATASAGRPRAGRRWHAHRRRRRPICDGSGPRAGARGSAVVLMGIGALLLRPVDERRREDVPSATVRGRRRQPGSRPADPATPRRRASVDPAPPRRRPQEVERVGPCGRATGRRPRGRPGSRA